MEGLKVYDKLENGCMLAAELNHVLLFLGKHSRPISTQWSERLLEHLLEALEQIGTDAF